MNLEVSIETDNNLLDSGLKIKEMYIKKDTDDKKFIIAFIKTLENNEIPIVKVSGNEAIAKLSKILASVDSILKDKYIITWSIKWDKDVGKKDGEIITILKYICIFKEIRKGG
ncbi:MAG: hypothetical protein KatS3mg068_1534 [Candidatus Sericytochromatia bacterium]|nr:MAG: hypothetical protein KatS3mg068_1534 [Candidatus Sericytochromatia bacterium]